MWRPLPMRSTTAQWPVASVRQSIRRSRAGADQTPVELQRHDVRSLNRWFASASFRRSTASSGSPHRCSISLPAAGVDHGHGVIAADRTDWVASHGSAKAAFRGPASPRCGESKLPANGIPAGLNYSSFVRVGRNLPQRPGGTSVTLRRPVDRDRNLHAGSARVLLSWSEREASNEHGRPLGTRRLT
jgi:hypothetical protein